MADVVKKVTVDVTVEIIKLPLYSQEYQFTSSNYYGISINIQQKRLLS